MADAHSVSYSEANICCILCFRVIKLKEAIQQLPFKVFHSKESRLDFSRKNPLYQSSAIYFKKGNLQEGKNEQRMSSTSEMSEFDKSGGCNNKKTKKCSWIPAVGMAASVQKITLHEAVQLMLGIFLYHSNWVEEEIQTKALEKFPKDYQYTI
ncbi:Hypothetical predicted protein [Paramuricea clavata]|uniref:Uncharacterized protein n=1 Tax=Paramuricea clavata TaxID=317549 RepID=A0A6S7IW14_PARCT|nr:Hypothetical predicted protein [Paramuricea clavata]